ncbi:hypothetical protein C1933_18695 [Stenotrophomonas sp. ZAC14D2_NAIMI4_6]|nr:hypothetical protein C1933_18695 [Stenotrophomonas sp. ZAC14D2_NAIMI4_6]
MLIIVRTVVKLIVRMRAHRWHLGLEHLRDLIERFVSIDPPSLQLRGDGPVLPRSISGARHTNVGAAGCDNLLLNLHIAESCSSLAPQQGIHVGLLGSWIEMLGKVMVSDFMRKRAGNSVALSNCILINDNLLTRHQVGTATRSPPNDFQTVAFDLRETFSKGR